jgi:hypothetical protein
MTAGVLPAQALRQLITTGALAASPAIRDDQIQPASLDLRLGPVAYRVRASFLAGHGRTVQERLDEFTMHKVNLAEGAVLEKNCVYVIPLAERLALPLGVTAVANAKSSSGRLDLLTRTITDGGVTRQVRDNPNGICSPEPFVNGVALGSSIGDSFHPTDRGHAFAGDAVAGAIAQRRRAR